jgi:type IV secretion system protein VirB10
MIQTHDPAKVSPVHDRAAEAMPSVVQPSSPWTLVLGLGGAALLGLVVFTSLSNGRQANAQPAPMTTAAAPVATSDLAPGLKTLLAQAPQAPPAPAAMAPLSAPSLPPVAPQPTPLDPPDQHWRAPAVIVDLSEAQSAPARLAQGPIPTPAATPEDNRASAEERFSARVSGAGVDTARATQLRDLTRTVPQGFVIPAVLETAIDSDLPGSVRAVVSRDVRGFDGSQVLVPRGSRLIGQYRSAAAVGQTRAFVVWSRIITPAGVSIDVGSPATDRLGRGGLEGQADSHFFQRFGASILLSVVSGGIDALARGGGGNTALVIGSPTQAQNVAAIALQKQIDIPTTIRVAQGAAVQVFVARDLDFSGVAAVR